MPTLAFDSELASLVSWITISVSQPRIGGVEAFEVPVPELPHALPVADPQGVVAVAGRSNDVCALDGHDDVTCQVEARGGERADARRAADRERASRDGAGRVEAAAGQSAGRREVGAGYRARGGDAVACELAAVDVAAERCCDCGVGGRVLLRRRAVRQQGGADLAAGERVLHGPGSVRQQRSLYCRLGLCVLGCRRAVGCE